MVRTTPALGRGLDILEIFLREPTPRTTSEIVEEVKLPRTTTHELVATLKARGYLDKGSDGRLFLGIRVFQLGCQYRAQLDLAREAHSISVEIAAQCEETVNVAVLEGTDVIYIATVDSIHPVRMVSAVGRKLPAHSTAVGKAMLAALPDEELGARYSGYQKLPARTSHTITSLADLRQQLDTIRAEGVAVDHREANDAVACFAVPIHDDTNTVVAAMSISVPIIRWSNERQKELTSLVIEGGRKLSHRLGHRDPGQPKSVPVA